MLEERKAAPTKIICTIGPKSSTEEIIKGMVEKGMSIARINFSHGTQEQHKEIFSLLNRIRSEDKYSCLGIAVDTKGPEIRTGTFTKERVTIAAGSTVRITTDKSYENSCTEEVIYIDHTDVFKDLEESNSKSIFIDDGKLQLEILSVNTKEKSITARARSTSTLSSKKGVNIPGTSISLPGVTKKDIEDIQFGIKHGADFVFASFIRTAKNVSEIKSIPGAESIKIISKIENEEGVRNIEEIINASDGVMIARGDLGIEVAYSRIFALQCKISYLCSRKGKPFVVATQMLESMTESLRPTRAEITDVGFAFAIGAGCVMLSGESASGIDPINTVTAMRDIILSTAEIMVEEELTLSICNDSLLPKKEILLLISDNKKHLRQSQIYFSKYSLYRSKGQKVPKEHIPTIPNGYKVVEMELE